MARILGDDDGCAVLADRQDVSNTAVYPDYVLFDTPLEDMYG
jgi:hypothetical protein